MSVLQLILCSESTLSKKYISTDDCYINRNLFRLPIISIIFSI